MRRAAPHILLLSGLLAAGPALAHASDGTAWADIVRVLTLQDYNTRVVIGGVTALGLAAGLIGSFMLLRERALLGDALSHATLPGIGLAFMVMVALGGEGKSLAGLLIGAVVTGVLGVLGILAIVHRTRIKEDTALGIVLSVFFGAGIAITGIIQNMDAGHAAGLQSFIYGKTASMLFADAVIIGLAGGLCALVCAALFKEFALLCFDPGFARAQGWPVLALDVLMMGLVVTVTVIGLQAVGLILMVALLVIPPAAARFWTHHLPTMVIAAALLGGLSCMAGAALSALVPRLPAGAVIVCVAGVCFAVSLVCGPARGVLARVLRQRSLARKVSRQHLLRALFEQAEHAGDGDRGVPLIELQRMRSWTAEHLRRELARAEREHLVRRPGRADEYALTASGRSEAWRVARNHRLWELFLITHADIAPSHVDRDADEVEHVLGPELTDQLEGLLAGAYPELATPPSPHALGSASPPPVGGVR